MEEDYGAALEGIRATMRGEQSRKPDSYLLRDVVLLLLDCGLRPEEVYRLKWEQVRRRQRSGSLAFWFARNAEGRGKSVIDPSDCRMQRA